MIEPEKTLREHLREAGRAGRGASKRRSREHYQRAVKIRWDRARERKLLQVEIQQSTMEDET